MDLTYYLDERDQELLYNEGSGWGTTLGGGGGGGSGSGWGGGGTTSDPDNDGWDHDDVEKEDEEKEDDEEETEELHQLTLKTTCYGVLMEYGGLAYCQQSCDNIPSLLAWINDHGQEEEDKHDSCLLIALSFKGNSPNDFFTPYELDWNFAKDFAEEDKPVFMGGFPFPSTNGTLTILAKWQEGHYNIAGINECFFAVLGEEINLTCSLIEWRTVAEITIDENMRVKVNGSYGSLLGNERFLT